MCGILVLVRVLGFNCGSREAYLAADDDGEIVDGLTERLQPPVGLEAGEALTEFIDSVRRVLREVKPDRIEILLPETWSAAYRQHLDRATLEMLAHATARARLRLPRTGRLDSHVISAAGAAVGRYWAAGRGLAALAAKAGGAA